MLRKAANLPLTLCALACVAQCSFGWRCWYRGWYVVTAARNDSTRLVVHFEGPLPGGADPLVSSEPVPPIVIRSLGIEMRRRAFGDDAFWWGIGYTLVVPLWIPFILFAFYPAIVAVRMMRAIRAGERPHACRRCGYDLTGNVTGVCPECGTETRLRLYRRRKGLCPNCGYALRGQGLGRCPVCSTPVESDTAPR
jgi:hypothetical protein